jgi:hypothetical protein
VDARRSQSVRSALFAELRRVATGRDLRTQEAVISPDMEAVRKGDQTVP